MKETDNDDATDENEHSSRDPPDIAETLYEVATSTQRNVAPFLLAFPATMCIVLARTDNENESSCSR